MKAYYQIISNETGTVLLKQRKIAKSLRWWLRENDFPFEHEFFIQRGFYFVKSKDISSSEQVRTKTI